MDCIIGIDVGSSSAKVGLFDLAGGALAIARREYATYTPASGRKEQEAAQWWGRGRRSGA